MATTARCRVITVLALWVSTFSMQALHAQTPPNRHARVDAELAQDLAGWAARLSRREAKPGAALPDFVALAPAELARTVCPTEPRGCMGLVAAYDTDLGRIVYRATLDMRDPTDQSFIVHELVHWLQTQQRTTAVDEDCEAVLAAEREAYAVQNRYLDRFKQWQRVGDVLRFTFCPAKGGAAAAPVVRYDASSGPLTTARPLPAPAASAPGLRPAP